MPLYVDEAIPTGGLNQRFIAEFPRSPAPRKHRTLGCHKVYIPGMMLSIATVRAQTQLAAPFIIVEVSLRPMLNHRGFQESTFYPGCWNFHFVDVL